MEFSVVRDGVIVTITYKLIVDGVLFDEINLEEPFEYFHGKGNIVPGLEEALEGKQVGDMFEVTLEPEEGYGKRNEKLVEVVPRSDFNLVEPQLQLKPGQILKLLNEEDDRVVNAVVRKFDESSVVLDYNPILAGKQLTYQVQVVKIRKPTSIEKRLGVPSSLKNNMTFGLT